MEAFLEEIVNLGRDNPDPAVRGLERIMATRSHNFLSAEEKHRIFLWKGQGQSFEEIAVALKRIPSTIKSFHKKWAEHQKFGLRL
jgi:hypothetical protein